MRSISAKAVIGAGYGDEGKGLLTDFLAAATPDSVVVRSNGGAQAGHTVVTPDGRRHVFHHIASGALAGAATHLSAHFVAHPMMMLVEWQTLRELGANVDVSCDPDATVTTPFDMMINQAAELARGSARHGSCGLGFGEAIERNLRPEFMIRMRDLFQPDLRARLWHIWSQWIPRRLAKLEIAALPRSIVDGLDVEGVVERYSADCAAFLDHVALWPDRRIAEKGHVIFEAAQGLMLDQDFGAFPHVTRSNTGLANMLAIAARAGIDAIEATYVTRCYVTRHGAGPLAHETAELDGIAIDDPTNSPNTWQGEIRTAPLDLAVLRDAIAHDLDRAQVSGVRVAGGLAVTCLDQASDQLSVQEGEMKRSMKRGHALQEIADSVGLTPFGESWGPTRDQFFAASRNIKAA